MMLKLKKKPSTKIPQVDGNDEELNIDAEVQTMKPKIRHAAVQKNDTVLNPLNLPPISKDTAASMSAAADEPEETLQKATIINCEHCDFKATTMQHLEVHVKLNLKSIQRQMALAGRKEQVILKMKTIWGESRAVLGC